MHGGENATHYPAGIFLIGELRKNAFERWLLHQIAQAPHSIVCHDFALAQNHNPRTDLLSLLRSRRLQHDLVLAHLFNRPRRPQHAAAHDGDAIANAQQLWSSLKRDGVCQTKSSCWITSARSLAGVEPPDP